MNRDCVGKKIRTFIAILPGTAFLKEFSAILNTLNKEAWAKEVRWVPENNLHITLRFLGEIEEELLLELRNALRKIGEETFRFDFTPSRIVLLPSPSKPRVIAVEMNQSEPLTNLAELVERAAISCGFEPEKRFYRGHITIGRCRKSFPGKQYIQTHFKGLLNRVNEISLMKSELKPTGAVYTSMEFIPLNTKKNDM